MMPSGMHVIGSPRLLVVDDDIVQRMIVSKVGNNAGYTTVSASSFEEALSILQRETFACITLDLSLGEHSGTDLLRQIAALSHARVIVISGCDQRILNSAVRLADSLGITSHLLPKPLDIQQLRAALISNRPSSDATAPKPKLLPAIEFEDLRAAVEREEIVPWFQPKVRLATGAVCGCESLARWKHPTLGMIPPDVFIPMAEEAGLMPRLTDSLIRQTAAAIHRLADGDPTFSVAVNVSASLLSDRSLFNTIEQALSDNGVPPSALVVEITESAAMSDVTRATETLIALRVRGIAVSLDDFGTGYASLAALARMPFNELKIDRMFVRDSAVDPDMARVVRACVQLGHEFGMQVVAEGIETQEVWRQMALAGCDIGQGYGFSPALDLDNCVQWMADWRRRDDVRSIA